ncbi:hypothetical protein SeMB42_g02979 [Synchytrium endobioticum]|uniref:Uncharacterized protein n=1 Tax=Synchytrium endobioticum TaxID=286115 RepID=A0A507DA98_9FUNG|nr:hypothetical protein SeMB42_g02979 [Synchytrium endobioticum]
MIWLYCVPDILDAPPYKTCSHANWANGSCQHPAKARTHGTVPYGRGKVQKDMAWLTTRTIYPSYYSKRTEV